MEFKPKRLNPKKKRQSTIAFSRQEQYLLHPDHRIQQDYILFFFLSNTHFQIVCCSRKRDLAGYYCASLQKYCLFHYRTHTQARPFLINSWVIQSVPVIPVSQSCYVHGGKKGREDSYKWSRDRTSGENNISLQFSSFKSTYCNSRRLYHDKKTKGRRYKQACKAAGL